MRQFAIIVVLLLFAASALAEGNKRHLFILAGQSNMERLDAARLFTPLLEAALPADQLLVIKDARGGQPIRRWVSGPGRSLSAMGRGPLYRQLLGRIEAETGGLYDFDSVTFIWMQGERDAREGLGAYYEEKLRALLAALQQDLARHDIGLVIGRISDHGLDGPRSLDWQRVREAQMRVADGLPLGSWVNTDDLNDGLGADGERQVNALHLTPSGYRELGRRFAVAAIRLLGQKAAGHKEPQPSQENDRTLVQNK
ncbi:MULTISPECIES: sialate O-acetylesterase [Microbulbifer]|nr:MULTISPECIES: sialate O-acetylesterase [Microbulbifer]KUJ83844.1 hypothetical protein AVO43_08465 [Microbulbifer sp. ZGT114]